jgi:hypothetical protein
MASAAHRLRITDLYNKQCWLVGDHLLLLRDLGPNVKIFMNVCVVITITIVCWSFAAKGFWASWDNIITIVMVMLLREACYVLHVL